MNGAPDAMEFLKGHVAEGEWLACEDDFPRFAEIASRYLLADLGETFVPLCDFHHDLVDRAQRFRRTCTLSPRDHLKSTIMSQLYPLWVAAYQPGGVVPRIQLISDTSKQAKGNLEYIVMLLESCPFLRHLIPDRPTVWKKDRIKLTNGSDIQVSGFGSPIRGGHKHLIILDDILGDTQRFEFTFIERFIRRAITPMLLPEAAMHVVGTPQHQRDPLMGLFKNPQYESRSYQAVLDWDKHLVLWPARWSWDLLMSRRAEIGNAAFAQEYQCEPIDDSSSLFPWEIISNNFAPDMVLRSARPPGLDNPIFVGVDIAKSARVGADWWVAIIVQVDKAGNRTILGIERERGLSLPAQLARLKSINERYEPVVMVVEANAMQSFVTDEAIRLTDLPIKPHTTGKEKAKVEEGVPGLTVLFENKKYRIPRGNGMSCEITDILARELNHFGWEGATVKGKGAHDDTVMALWLAELAIRGKGWRRLRRFSLR